MGIVHWIHISDLHLNKVGTQTDAMRESLPSYLNNLARHNKVHYIFFTGDLRFAPLKTFSEDTGNYFEQLRNATGIGKEAQFIVIGNHDIDRENKPRLKAIEKLEKTYFDNDSVIDKKLIRALKCGRRKFFYQLNSIITEEQYNLHVDQNRLHFLLKTKDLNIVHVDSTLTYREHKENDFLIGSYALREVLKSCDKNKPTIILSHYPPSSLEPNEEKAVLQILKSNNVQIWLAGHKHTEIIYKDLDYVYVVHSGNQTYEKGTSPGFVEGYLDTDNGQGHFIVHKWNESSGWAVYQTLSAADNTEERAKYSFVIDRKATANEIKAERIKSPRDILCDYLNDYQGNTILTRILVKKLNMNKEQLIKLLEELQDEKYLRVKNIKKSQWEILIRPI